MRFIIRFSTQNAKSNIGIGISLICYLYILFDTRYLISLSSPRHELPMILCQEPQWLPFSTKAANINRIKSLFAFDFIYSIFLFFGRL